MSSDHLKVTPENMVVSSRDGSARSLMVLDGLSQMYVLLGNGVNDGWRVDSRSFASLSLASLVS